MDTVQKQFRNSSSDYLDKQVTLTARMMYFAATGNVEGLTRMDQEYDLSSMENGSVFVNARGFDGRTALHLAASGGHAKAVMWLMERGADVEALDAWSGTPLQDALRRRHTGVARILIKGGAVLPEDACDERTASGLGGLEHKSSAFKSMSRSELASPSSAASRTTSTGNINGCYLDRTSSFVSNGTSPGLASPPLPLANGFAMDHFVEIKSEEIFWMRKEQGYGKIGEGSFGEVFKAFWHNTPVAVKRLNDGAVDDETIILWRAELSIISKLVHPNIVQFLGAVTAYKPFYIVRTHAHTHTHTQSQAHQPPCYSLCPRSTIATLRAETDCIAL